MPSTSINSLFPEKARLVTFLWLLSGFYSLAQTSTISPYSRFGPGDVIFSGYAHQRAMGGTSIAQHHVARLNFANPATYAYDSLMVMEFGVSGEGLTLEQGALKSKQWNARMDYLTFSVPLWRNKVGLSLGFLPFSGLGYNIRYSEVVDSSNALTASFEGKGGFNRYFAGAGVKLLPNLSIGANVSYLYGTIEQLRKARYSNLDFFSTRFRDEITVGDFYVETGLHWFKNLKKDYRIAAGVTFAAGQKLKAKRNILWENYKDNVFGIEITRDTVQFTEDESGSVVMPVQYGAGLLLARSDRWLLQGDFRYQQWRDFRSFKGSDSLDNSFRISLGGQYTVDSRSNRYFSRIQYRAGAYYSRTFLNLRGTTLNDQGITLGAGFPIRKAYQSQISISLEGGQRGTLENNLIRERYVRFMVGITFNEDWFRRIRYE